MTLLKPKVNLAPEPEGSSSQLGASTLVVFFWADQDAPLYYPAVDTSVLI